MKPKILLSFFLSLLAFSATHAQNGWPKDIRTEDGAKISVYELQPETLTNNTLTGRAAISYRKSENDEPVFGAMLFTADIRKNFSGMAEITSMHVTNAKLSGT